MQFETNKKKTTIHLQDVLFDMRSVYETWHTLIGILDVSGYLEVKASYLL